MSFVFEVNCNICEDGVILVGPSCSYPASMCCGGCYQEISCDHCGGSGKITAEFSNEYLQEIIEFHFDGELENAHELVMEIIKSESN
jgi:hypothetical protein